MNAAQNELLAALANFFCLSILFNELIVCHACVTSILCQITKEVIKEEIEGLQEVSMILNILLDITLGHSKLDSTTIPVLHQLVNFK